MTNSNSTSKLDQLRTMTTVVADTGDIDAIRQYRPDDATTNPSLLLKAAQMSQYDGLVRDCIAGVEGSSSDQMQQCCDRLAVKIGLEILKLIPGRISTEVDARLSFDTRNTVERAKRLVGLYEQAGRGRERLLVKVASTWEGIRAVEQLEKIGINCNLTLLFCFTQASAAADAGAYLISPFVGRILDWHKAHSGRKEYTPEDDPGVISVTEIYRYYKACGYNTVVMGASFRSSGEIEALAGCDRLTISPTLLEQLAADHAPLQRRLQPDQPSNHCIRLSPIESDFRYQLNEDAMATDKLAEGIRQFVHDQKALEQLLKHRMTS
ncbi:MAG: transaldolase [Porticoccaceae bacterium]